MGIKIATFLLNPLIKKWVNKLANNLTGIIEFENYCDLNQLIEKYIFKVKKNEHIFVLIDVENELTTKIGFKLNQWGINVERITLTDLAEIDSIRLINDTMDKNSAIVLQNLEHG